MDNLFKCSICGDSMEENKIAIKWNQEMREGWGLCIGCKNLYRGKQKTSLEIETNKIQNDSYNYLTTTTRQMLYRHGFVLSESTIGGLRSSNYVKWSLKATSSNNYIIKVILEIEKKDVRDYVYKWDIKTFNPEGVFLKELLSDKPSVPVVKNFLNGFFNDIGSNPYIYFRSTFKSVLSKHSILISESKENEKLSTYKGKFLSEYRWTAEIEKDCKWNVKVYKLRGRGACLEQHNGKSFAIPPLKEFFNRIVKKY
jgi:hypothetical protein